MSSVHERDCLRKETVPVSGRSSTQSSVIVQRGSILYYIILYYIILYYIILYYIILYYREYNILQ